MNCSIPPSVHHFTERTAFQWNSLGSGSISDNARRLQKPSPSRQTASRDGTRT